MKNIKKILEKPLKELNIIIDEIKYEKDTLYIIIDSMTKTCLNINQVVEATKIINPILDSADLIKDRYVLDVSSKERG